MTDLTDRQAKVWQFICRNVAEQHQPPTILEIANYIGASHKTGGNCHLEALEKKGYIARDRGRIRLLKAKVTVEQA